jgi:hypothetical protein
MELDKQAFNNFIKSGRVLLTSIAPLCGEDYKVTDQEINVMIRQASQVGRAVLSVINSMHVEAPPFAIAPEQFVGAPPQREA